MTRPTADDDARILPLRAAAAPSLASLLEAVVASAARPGVRTACEVDPWLRCDADPATVRGLLEPLVRDAVAAALESDPASDAPMLREVLVTAVDTGDALEIEVADSGPARCLEPPAADVRRLLSAVFGAVSAAACAEGGTAVTLRLPHRRARGLAA
jgi:hypothetical protein